MAEDAGVAHKKAFRNRISEIATNCMWLLKEKEKSKKIVIKYFTCKFIKQLLYIGHCYKT